MDTSTDTPTSAGEHSVAKLVSPFESFPNYNNFPSQWDLSEMESPLAAPHAHCTEQSATAAEVSEMPIPVGDSDSVFGETCFAHDPFPKTRTFPVYWDLSR